MGRKKWFAAIWWFVVFHLWNGIWNDVFFFWTITNSNNQLLIQPVDLNELSKKPAIPEYLSRIINPSIKQQMPNRWLLFFSSLGWFKELHTCISEFQLVKLVWTGWLVGGRIVRAKVFIDPWWERLLCFGSFLWTQFPYINFIYCIWFWCLHTSKSNHKIDVILTLPTALFL